MFSFCSSHTLSKVRELTERLQPPELMPSPLAKLASPCRPAPASIKDILVSGLTERGTGKDWEHFARGLGSDRQKEEYDRIRVREGPASCCVELRFSQSGAFLSESLREVVILS